MDWATFQRKLPEDFRQFQIFSDIGFPDVHIFPQILQILIFRRLKNGGIFHWKIIRGLEGLAPRW